ncbi:hypothetical protein [Streptomyces sp. NPDC056921]|uniref:hypothetical protein n=1 Tax=Streptomyces sp. NPDC056921 TaxID=3345966 RepID=UPI0036298719
MQQIPQEMLHEIVQGMTQEIPGPRIPPVFSRGQLLGVSSAQERIVLGPLVGAAAAGAVPPWSGVYGVPGPC